MRNNQSEIESNSTASQSQQQLAQQHQKIIAFNNASTKTEIIIVG